jgi:hypothetical protein
MVADHDYGPEFRYVDLSGVITKEPPAVKQLIPTFVPQVDADGSDLGGVPSVCGRRRSARTSAGT